MAIFFGRNSSAVWTVPQQREASNVAGDLPPSTSTGPYDEEAAPVFRKKQPE